ncbi:MAG: serine hydrolase domain-containing protein [Pyrinomonadaceae bacterium]
MAETGARTSMSALSARGANQGRMVRTCILIHLVLTLLVILRASLAQQKTINFDELKATVNEELKATNTPGAAVVVISGDQIVFAKGFGVSNVETRTPVTPDTLFRIASTTKMLTAAALVALADQGKIKLDEPIGKYVTFDIHNDSRSFA